MARNGTGTYSVPNTFVAGTTITASDHNENWSDIGSELTNSVAADGQTTMTGPLKAASGTLAAPSHTFGSDTDTGRYRKTANTMADVCGGVEVVEISSTGLDVTGTIDATTVNQGGAALLPPGVIMDYGGTSAPTGWLLCYGQAVSRTTYSGLFSAISTTFGVGDNSTTFNLPDLRGRVAAGKDDMGGSAASRLSSTTMTADGATLGAVGGAETVTIAQANLPSVNFTVDIPSGQGTHLHDIACQSVTSSGNAAVGYSNGGGAAIRQTGNATLPALTGTAASGGSGTALNKVQPTIILNKIIKT